MRSFIWCALLVALIGGNERAVAQTSIELKGQSDGDIVGDRFIYQVREAFRASRGFRLTTADEPRMRVSILTMDTSASSTGHSSAYMVVWVIFTEPGENFPTYVNSTLGVVGANRVREVAEQLVAETDQVVQEILNMN